MAKRRSLLDWEQDAIVAAIKSGEKEDAVAAEFGVSEGYPHILARRRGVPARANGRPRKSVQFQETTLDIQNKPITRRDGSGLLVARIAP